MIHLTHHLSRSWRNYGTLCTMVPALLLACNAHQASDETKSNAGPIKQDTGTSGASSSVMSIVEPAPGTEGHSTPGTSTTATQSPPATNAEGVSTMGLVQSCADLADAGLMACAEAGPLCPTGHSPRFCDDDRGCFCGPGIRHSNPI
jgi:hypothetical protein